MKPASGKPLSNFLKVFEYKLEDLKKRIKKELDKPKKERSKKELKELLERAKKLKGKICEVQAEHSMRCPHCGKKI